MALRNCFYSYCELLVRLSQIDNQSKRIAKDTNNTVGVKITIRAPNGTRAAKACNKVLKMLPMARLLDRNRY